MAGCTAFWNRTPQWISVAFLFKHFSLKNMLRLILVRFSLVPLLFQEYAYINISQIFFLNLCKFYIPQQMDTGIPY